MTLSVLECSTGALRDATALCDAKLDQGTRAPYPAESVTNSHPATGWLLTNLSVSNFYEDALKRSIILFPLNRVRSLCLFTQRCHYAH